METKTTHIRNSRYLIITFIYGLVCVKMVLPLCTSVYNPNNVPSSSAEDCQREKKSDSIFSFKKNVLFNSYLCFCNNKTTHMHTGKHEQQRIVRLSKFKVDPPS